jgi:hypothetical protein
MKMEEEMIDWKERVLQRKKFWGRKKFEEEEILARQKFRKEQRLRKEKAAIMLGRNHMFELHKRVY